MGAIKKAITNKSRTGFSRKQQILAHKRCIERDVRLHIVLQLCAVFLQMNEANGFIVAIIERKA